MTAERMAEIARRLDALDPDLYNDVLELLQESRRLAVEEYQRENPAPVIRSPFDKRRIIKEDQTR